MTRSMVVTAFIAMIAVLTSGCAPGTDLPGEDTLVIFHNGTGPMCLEAVAWLGTMQAEHPELVVAECLTTNPANLAILADLKLQYDQSQGVSTTFGYWPVIFFRSQAFSGFNEDVQAMLEILIDSAAASSS